MTVCTDIADYRWLTGDEACAIAGELAAAEAPLHAVVSRLRGRYSRERTHLLLEQLELRRRAAEKFAECVRMFFTRVGLEQATDQWVARYKAARFATSSEVVDLCCGIGGDLAALARESKAVGVDCDPVAAHFAAVNARVPVRCADAAQCNVDEFAAWHIDPDRRPAGRRTTSLEVCQPSRQVIEQLLARVPHAGVKLAPATRLPPHWAEHCELDWISRHRQCRQLVAWHGTLAQAPGRRCATVLSSSSGAPRRVIGEPDQPTPVVARPDRYVFDVDPAVCAAGLQGALAAEHGLMALATGPTYLTGPCAVADRALACFETADVLPLDNRRLARHLRHNSIGCLEIKKRGVAIDPEALRRSLKPRGAAAATLLITRVANRPTAIVAHRVRFEADY